VVDLLIHDAVVRCTTNLMMRFIARTDKDFTHIKEVIDYDISVLFSKLILSGADDTFFIKCKENLDKKANDIDLDGNQTDLLHFYDKCLGKITSTVAALSDKSLSIGKITSLANEYFDEKTVIVGKPKENDIVSAENADILGLTEKELFIQKSLVTKNEYLAVIYEKIKSGEEIERDDYFAVDGMGLTPLHYALMLKNFELAKKIINSTKDYSVVLEDIPEELEALYDYKTWVIQAGEDSLLDLLLERTEEIVVLRKTQAHIKRLLMVNKGFTAFGDYTISSGKSAAREARRRGDYDRYDDLSSRASDLNDKLDATKEKGRELQEQIDDIEREINEAKSRLRLFFRQQTNDLRKKSGFGKFVFDILEKPSLYEQILYGDYERVLFKYYGLYFYAKQDFSAWKEYKKEKAWQQNGRKNSSTNKKWFSDAAHNDLDVLTSEYRKLVVKYHPDNNPDGIEDFLLIQREREQILGKMKL
jgi:hypothetical protein